MGGTINSLHAHIKAVRCHKLFGDDIDFKLAASLGAASEQAASETGFKSLSVSICEVRSPVPSHGQPWEPGTLWPFLMSPLSLGDIQTLAHIQESQHPERLVPMQEVVALQATASCSPAQLPQAAAPHALPQDFHSLIARAEQQAEKETVLLDVRNFYETRIGRFSKVRGP